MVDVKLGGAGIGIQGVNIKFNKLIINTYRKYQFYFV